MGVGVGAGGEAGGPAPSQPVYPHRSMAVLTHLLS